MIDLSSELSLGSLVLTRDGTLRYSYILPRGMEFPDDAEGHISFTDRAGGEYDFSPHYGELSEDLTKITWVVDSNVLNHIPAGANFEVFISYDGDTYKVRYGRVVRKEVSFPLNPGTVEAPPLMYEDDMQRSMPGPRWIAKYGRMAMHDRGESATPRWAMAARNTIDIFGAGISLWASTATLWYAPLQSDTIEMSVGLHDADDGICTVVLCSNYSMTSFIGVRFTDPLLFGTDSVQVVTGTRWDNTSTVGSSASYNVPSAGIYKIAYSINTNQVSVTAPNGTGLLNTTISTSIPHGPGYRYVGAIWQGSLQSTGPRIYYWKVKDAV